MLKLDDLTAENPLLLHGDCIEVMKTIPDASVDLFICDLPYGETNCAWDTKIDLGAFWKEFKRIRKSKSTACIHFCSTGFGYSLIKSWEKGFKMDMVWKKRNKTGGLQSRFRPMRNHEMVYFFYEQAPKYNRDKYHKRIRTTEPNAPTPVQGEKTPVAEEKYTEHHKTHHKSAHGGSDVVTVFTKENIKAWNKANPPFVPPTPASVLEEATVYGATKKDKGWWAHNSFKGNENPASVLEEQEKVDVETNIYGEPPLPVSMFESGKCPIGKRNHQTEKPQDILEFFLKYWSDPGDVILDPTMGSGSTGVACKRMGRNFIGMELTDKYYAVAQKRISDQAIEEEIKKMEQ